MSFIFDLPLAVTGPLILLLMVSFSLGGMSLFRRRVLPRLRFGGGDSHFSAAMLSSIMVFYGLAMALIAVHVWETFENVEKITTHEATTLAALFRDASEYPEPTRTLLRDQLRDYTSYVIHEAWPLQHHGRVPREGVERMDRFESVLLRFEPQTEGQKVLAAETQRAYNVYIEARRMRLDAVDTHLPGVMWMIILLGAVISVISAFYFPVVDARVHSTQLVLLATFIGIVIFMVLALDRPFRGDLAVRSAPYQLIYDQLMSR